MQWYVEGRISLLYLVLEKQLLLVVDILFTEIKFKKSTRINRCKNSTIKKMLCTFWKECEMIFPSKMEISLSLCLFFCFQNVNSKLLTVLQIKIRHICTHYLYLFDNFFWQFNSAKKEIKTLRKFRFFLEMYFFWAKVYFSW